MLCAHEHEHEQGGTKARGTCVCTRQHTHTVRQSIRGHAARTFTTTQTFRVKSLFAIETHTSNPWSCDSHSESLNSL